MHYEVKRLATLSAPRANILDHDCWESMIAAAIFEPTAKANANAPFVQVESAACDIETHFRGSPMSQMWLSMTQARPDLSRALEHPILYLTLFFMQRRHCHMYPFVQYILPT